MEEMESEGDSPAGKVKSNTKFQSIQVNGGVSGEFEK
jgi:hypothetical protein